MKPLGMFFTVWSSSDGPAGLDDDYDWHVRRAALERPTAPPPPAARRASSVGRLLSSARSGFARMVAQTARRA